MAILKCETCSKLFDHDGHANSAHDKVTCRKECSELMFRSTVDSYYFWNFPRGILSKKSSLRASINETKDNCV